MLELLGLEAPDASSKHLSRPDIGQLPRLNSVYSTVFDKSNGSKHAEEFVKGMDTAALSTWGILYCGGAKPVEEALNKVSRKYKLSLNTESFA
eukprot:scaffold667755_cov45-Prasinocladus_malaysianus.AAC.1